MYEFINRHPIFISCVLIFCFLVYQYIIKPRIERRENGLEKKRRSADSEE